MRGTLTAIGFVALVMLGYAISCACWPYARCRLCSGTGRHERKDGKKFRLCGWCDGTGRRLRIGRRVFSYWRKRRAAAR